MGTFIEYFLNYILWSDFTMYIKCIGHYNNLANGYDNITIFEMSIFQYTLITI